MKLFKLLPLLGVMLVSCQDGQRESNENDPMAEQTRTDTISRDTDEVFSDWEEAWKSNDPQNVRDLTAEDAILLLNGQLSPGDSIEPWIERSSTGMRDLQMESRLQNSSDRIVYDVGTYSHGYQGDTVQYRGAYTFIWERTNGDWEVKVMNISTMSEEDMELAENP